VTQTTFSSPRTVIFPRLLDFRFFQFIISQDNRIVGANNGPHRYEPGLGAEANVPKFPASASPIRPFGVTVHSHPQSNPHNDPSYNAHPSTSVLNEDHSVAVRGMAVEDDYGFQQSHQHMSSAQTMPHPRGPPIPQPPFGGYNPYYTVPTIREPYLDFSYGYDAYRGPADATMYPSQGIGGISSNGLYPPVAQQGLHLNAVPDIHHTRQGIFYDYGVAARPGSQFYYPTQQPIMYPPTTHSPMVGSQLPATLGDKKRELQVSL
jgi:hypothetical protein